MDPKITELSEVFERFKAAFARDEFDACTELLSQLKVLLTGFKSLPPLFEETPNAIHELALARDIFEHAVVLSVKIEDQDAFERDFFQLKPYYTDACGRLPPSSQEYPFLGLNLLRLLVQNRIPEFHTELELFSLNALENPYIKYTVELEQSFSEGAYNRVLSARQTVPHETYVYFMDLLVKRVSAESVSEGSSEGIDTNSQNDERELKRPRREQSNSEYAHPSRLLMEVDELALVPTSSPSLYTSAKLSDRDEKAGAVALDQPREKALLLKTLAEQKYASNHLKSALKYAKRAHKLHPSLEGLPEMLTSFKILHIAAEPIFESSSATQNPTPDYYKVLQVERFAHINLIKKQYKKLALTLHPDKNPSVASGDAFKLVGEAARVLSDKIRRKEYDMRLRIAMQSKATEEIELGAEGEKTFWTACSTCRLLHQFERKYLGHNLMCPRCKKSFKAIEVEEDRNNVGDVVEKSEGFGVGQKRVSTRIRERAAKCPNLGIVEKCGLGVKRKISSMGEVLKRSGVEEVRNMDEDGVLLKDLMSKSMEKVEKLGDHDGGRIERFRSKKVGNLANRDRNGYPEGRDIGVLNELRLKTRGAKVKDGVEDALKSGVVEIVGSERTKRAKVREEETMTLSQMQMLVKKKKLVEGKLMKEKEVNVEKLEPMEKEVEKEEEEEMVNLREKRNRRGVSKDRNLEVVKRTSKNPVHSETRRDIASTEGNVEIVLVEEEKEKEKEAGKEKEKEMKDMSEKRQTRRVSKYGNLEVLKTKTSKNRVGSEIRSLITKKKGNLEILPVEDSDFHDFDKDRREKSFKKGQVWAVYDDGDGMPRQYALIDEILSINPFKVTLSWLQIQSNGDEELISWQKMGFHVSCGSFLVSRKVSIKYLNLFSHVADCERAAREMYKIYPKKGSVWALYNKNALDTEGSNQRVKDKRCYDIVVCLSSYSDIHGLSIAHLEKVDGFRTVFKRRAVGANAVVCLGKNDVKLFSHQIPAKKLSGEEASGLPKDCWELDPASLTQQLLTESK